MKRFVLIVMSLLVLLLSACGTPPSPPVSETPAQEALEVIFHKFELEGRRPWNWREHPNTLLIYIPNPEHTLLVPRPIIALDNYSPKN